MPDPDARIARWYRRLLLLCPFEFRRDYGSEMSGVFTQQHRDSAEGGTMSRTRLWLDTIAGILRVGPGQHLAALRQDTRDAFRSLRRTPVFTVAAVLAIGLGVGANAAVFGLVNAVLLDPLPVEDPSGVLLIQLLDRKDGRHTPVSTDNFRDIRERQPSFSRVAAFSFTQVTMQDRQEPEVLNASVVGGAYFELLGVRPRIGRAIQPHEDHDDSGDPVAVLSHRLWTRSFGASPDAIGRVIGLNGVPFTVIGVAPEAFRGTFGLTEPDIYVPLGTHERLNPGAPWSRGRLWRWLFVVGRLAPAVSPEAARAELRVLGDQFAEEFPQFNQGRTLAGVPLNQAIAGPDDYGTFTRAGWLLSAVVAVVLLVACLNLANLMLARALSRSRDLALRVALGAGRGRLVRQLLTESLLLGLAGGAAGLLFAHWTFQALWAMRPPALDRPGFAVELSLPVLLFAMLAAVAASLLCGLVPAIHVSRTDVTRVLNEGGRQPGLGRGRIRSAFVVAEVAMAVVAVVAAGLFVRGLQQAQAIDPGFVADGLTVMEYSLPAGAFDGPRARLLHQRLVGDLSSRPGIRVAAVSDRGLLEQGIAQTINIVGQEPPPDGLGFLVDTARVTPEYFDALGLAIVSGRAFTHEDRPGGRPVAIVNETMARRFWAEGNAVGQRFTSRAADAELEVVAVAADAKYETLGGPPMPFFYQPLLASEAAPVGSLTLLVGSDPGGQAVAAARASMRTLAPAVALQNARAAEALLSEALWAPRTTAALVSAFGALALVLAMIGVYSVMAYTVSQRTQEIGLRMALGATPRSILRLVVGNGMMLAAAGIAAGAALTLLGAGLARGLLYGANPRDPFTFMIVSLTLGVLCLLACYLPARRAARLDPVITLRG